MCSAFVEHDERIRFEFLLNSEWRSNWTWEQHCLEIQNQLSSRWIFRCAEPLDLTVPLPHEMGWILFRRVDDAVDVMNLAVREKGKGWGGAMLREWIGQLKASGVSRVYLEVSEQNKAALALYKKIGFVQTRRRDRYYHGVFAAIEMQLQL